MKSNFTQALKELTGFDGEPAQINPAYEEPVFQSPVITVEDIYTDSSNEDTRITSTMIIKGDIKSTDNIFIEGKVIGNIQTTGNVSSTNLIMGNVSAENMSMKNARLKGDIKTNGDLILGTSSVVVGNLICENITISGKVKGNCNVATTAMMTKDSYLLGDVHADEIITEQGAKIIGSISIRTSKSDLDSDFDFGGDL